MYGFGDERKRKINLGGASGSTSHTDIIQRVQNERLARQEQKKRADSAVAIQAWYRGLREAKETRREMRKAFDRDVLGLTGLRCLVLIGRDEEVLGQWTTAMLQGGEGQIFSPATGPNAPSWLVLVRQVSLLLLQSVADDPSSFKAPAYLQFLNTLLSVESATRVVGADGPALVTHITDYLLNHRMYNLLSQAIQRIPVKSKDSPSLAPLLNISVLPLASSLNSPHRYAQFLINVFVHILTIPVLPSRLLSSNVLPQFISQLPLAHLEILNPHVSEILENTSIESKIHLATTLYVLISPSYKHLPSPSFETYLGLSIALFNTFPLAIFEPKEKDKKGGKSIAATTTSAWANDGYGSDDGAPSTRVSVVTSFDVTPSFPPPVPKIDSKTLNRLSNIVAAPHLTSLIHATQSKSALFPRLIDYLFSVTTTWSSSSGQILNVVLASTGGALVREIYRDLVRRSPLGQEENSGNVLDPASASYYPPLLFLADLYSQALLTMGDDEFFGSSRSGGPVAAGGRAVRNPLTLDELVSLSKQLLNVAFTLYWRDDGGSMADRRVSPDVRVTWEVVRDKVTRCLLGIHARDSRKPFVPPDHWLVTSQLDMNSFVEAAVLEEQTLASSPDASNGTVHPLPRNRVPSKRQMASISPRLGILNNIPFAIPFAVRVSIFRHFVVNDMVLQDSMTSSGSWGMRSDPFMRAHGRRKTRVQVRRGMVAQDGFDRLGDADLKAPVEISFIDQFGQEEAGIDGGGVFKEFFTSLCKEVFDTDRGLWLANKKNELYPNPHAYATEAHSLNWYRFIGRILGKAMYEGILVDVAFAGFFLAKWLGRQSFLDDLASLDPELYNGLVFLKHYPGNVEDLSLNFTVAAEEFGVTKTIDLIPNGSNVAVTKENRLQYIAHVSHYRLSKQIKKQSEAFFEGLSEMIDQKWLRMFNQQEVQILIGGVNTPIDTTDLRKNTNYGGLYDDDHPTIKAFWNVVDSLDQEQQRSMLRFVTSCSRPPLLGFKELVPNFSIRDAGDDQYRLPTSSTCVNLLKLPRYTSERTLRDKLIQAINSGAGFDLS